MKLFKAIKLHWRLRIRQEYVCNKVVKHSQIITPHRTVSPYLNELSSLNKAVKKIDKKIPDIYFFLSDVFGGASLLRRRCKEYQEREDERLFPKIELFVWNLVPNPGFTEN